MSSENGRWKIEQRFGGGGGGGVEESGRRLQCRVLGAEFLKRDDDCWGGLQKRDDRGRGGSGATHRH